MVLTDCRDQLDSYSIDCALKYLSEKLSEHPMKRLLAENTMFAEVGFIVRPGMISHKSACILMCLHAEQILLQSFTAMYHAVCLALHST